MNSLALLASLFLGWGTPAPSQPNAPVFTVAPSPDSTADFDDLQVAIDSVPDGSTLILEPGHHDNLEDFFVIDGKSLTLIGRELYADPASARLMVRNLSSDQSVYVRGLISKTTGGGIQNKAVLHAENCLGSLFAEDCFFDGTSGASLPSATALRVADVGLSQFVRCEVDPGANYFGGAGGSAWISGASNAVFYDCAFTGKCGFSSGYCSGCGSGLVVGTGSSVWTFGGTAEGDYCNSFGPVSSPGISVHVGASLTLRGTVATPGIGSGATTPGVDVEAGGAFTEWSPTTSRDLVTPHLIDAGASIPLVAMGEPGDLFLLYMDFEAGLLELPELGSLLHLPSPIFLLGPTALDASGTQSLSLLAPSLPVGESLSAFFQGLFIPTTPGAGPLAILSHPSLVTAQG